MKLKLTVTFDPFSVDPTKLMEAVKGCGIQADAIETHPARETKPAKKAGKAEAKA